MNPTASPGVSEKCPRNRRQNEASLHQDIQVKSLFHLKIIKSDRMHVKVECFLVCFVDDTRCPAVGDAQRILRPEVAGNNGQMLGA